MMPAIEMERAGERVRTVNLQPSLWLILKATWLFTWRGQLAMRKVYGVALAVLALPLLVLFTVKGGNARAYFHWILEFHLLLMLPLYCLGVCGAMIRDELQNDTIGFFSTRPVTRAQLYIAKYVSHVLWIELLVLCHGLLALLAGDMRQIPDVWKLAPYFLGVQALSVIGWCALSGFFGLLSKRFMVIGLVYGFIVEVGIARIPTNINALSLTKHIKTLLANSQVLQPWYDWSSDKTALAASIMIIAPFFIVGLSALMFSVREYHHVDEMQK